METNAEIFEVTQRTMNTEQGIERKWRSKSEKQKGIELREKEPKPKNRTRNGKIQTRNRDRNSAERTHHGFGKKKHRQQ
jgi:hypothetical protein